METPRHWAAPVGPLALLLAPLGWIYGRVTAWRMARSGARADCPVICIGNFTAGGAGKTPVALAIAEMLRATGETPVIVSRGYGGRLAGPVRVDVTQHTSADIGDEPLLLARHMPVIVARDKVAGASAAAAAGATVIVLDDGLQNPALHKDMTIAVIDAAFGVGNGLCLPAGPLRAPLHNQMRHVDAVLMLGNGAINRSADSMVRAAGKPVFSAAITPNPDDVEALSGKPLLAFAGIGRPEKFFETLWSAGLDVRATMAFADHHAFTEQDHATLVAKARESGLTLVTTEKDATRLPSGFAAVLHIAARIETPAILSDLLQATLRKRRSEP
jgi:tetraacyldisaccharide 4'-kinase